MTKKVKAQPKRDRVRKAARGFSNTMNFCLNLNCLHVAGSVKCNRKCCK